MICISGKHFVQLFTHIPYFSEEKHFDISAKTWGHKHLLFFFQKLTLVRVYFKFIDIRIIAIIGWLVFKDKFYFWSDMIVQTLPLQYNDYLRETWTQIKRLAGMMTVARYPRRGEIVTKALGRRWEIPGSRISRYIAVSRTFILN